MTGLKPDSDRIIELAIVVTGGDLSTVAEAPVWAVHQDDFALDAMDSWNKSTHGRSGLIDRVKASVFTEAGVEAGALAFLREHVPAKASPMCGNPSRSNSAAMVHMNRPLYNSKCGAHRRSAVFWQAWKPAPRGYQFQL